MLHDEVIPILDFGSQYAQLIARRVREKGVYSELVRPNIPAADLRKLNPKGLILSGGPSSVYEPNAPRCDERIFDLGVPRSRHLLRHADRRPNPRRPGQTRQGPRVWPGQAPGHRQRSPGHRPPRRHHRLDEPRRSSA